MIQRLIFLFLGISLIACQTDKQAVTANSFKLSGTITNAVDTTLTLSRGSFEQVISLDEAGNFTSELSNIDPGTYHLKNARNRAQLYLEPNGELKMTADVADFRNTVKYIGDLAPQNNYLIAKSIARKKENIDFKTLFSSNEADFLAQVDERFKRTKDLMNGFEGLPDSYKAFEGKSFDYERLLLISQYESTYQYFTKEEDFKASAEFKKPLEGINYDDEETFLNYQNFQYMTLGEFKDDDIMVNVEKLKTFKSDEIKTSMVSSLKHMLSPNMDNLEASYKALVGLSKDEELNKEITEIKLEDLKGKNVYIDVWATWCGPCKAEIPSLKALEKEYHNKNIEFVSISVDKQKDADKWKAMIEEKELKGVQLLADKDWKSDFVQGYGIKGIPRFILVDDKGRIVSADAARPSDDENVKKLFSEVGI